MTDRKSHWEKVYHTRSPKEVSWYQEDPRVSLELIDAAGLSPQDAILDAGGGASTLVDKLLDRGYQNITILDIAETALVESKKRLGPRAKKVHWIGANLLAFQAPQAYRLWHDRAVFHFLTDPEDRCRYLKTLQNSLTPGSQVILSTFSLTGPDKCSGLPVQGYDLASLTDVLGPSFHLKSHRAETHQTPQGKTQDFLYGLFEYKGPSIRR